MLAERVSDLMYFLNLDKNIEEYSIQTRADLEMHAAM